MSYSKNKKWDTSKELDTTHLNSAGNKENSSISHNQFSSSLIHTTLYLVRTRNTDRYTVLLPLTSVLPIHKTTVSKSWESIHTSFQRDERRMWRGERGLFSGSDVITPLKWSKHTQTTTLKEELTSSRDRTRRRSWRSNGLHIGCCSFRRHGLRWPYSTRLK